MCVCVYSSTCLLPVLVEEEESVQDSPAEISTVSASMEGEMFNSVCAKQKTREEKLIFLSRLFVFAFLDLSATFTTHALTLLSFLPATEQLSSSTATTLTDSSSLQSPPSSAPASQSASSTGSATSGPSQSEDTAGKKESLPPSGKKKRVLVRPAPFPCFSKVNVCLVFTFINADEE